ncbi:caspase family protein [Taklimakanibacter lacteus]|uniref:caspase family protein n=1 Tax=Taklimakanibacter lacteus TaxID=2268456 RepID=UPI000E673D89
MRNPASNAVKTVIVAVSVLLLALLSPTLAQDGKPLKGVALIIGQSHYAHVTPLANPSQDARAVDGLLTNLGFDTRSVTDRDADKLKRDLDRFIEDAEGADVALLYYSGHGIEAGGENYLIPIDADPASLADAGERLMPLSQVMERLKRNVPVVILLLDACRTNPFPPGATIMVAGQAEPQPVAAIGLGAPRGMSVAEEQAQSDNLGMVIGLAAEPGRAALDGEPGQNSPYAAALLRHFSALKGEEFGTVMRMVTEEVYLATKTRQRPWINESLRRLLYFGGTAPEATGDSGLITRERRQLLLTIARLPTAERKQVETIADKDGVSLDALYGIARAMGATDIPKDPVVLEKFLRAQAATLKKMVTERDALKPYNPEIARLAGAADAAIRQGAIATARSFLDQAVAIVEKDRASVDAIEERVKERRIADAAVYAKRAEAASLAFDFLAAARDYDRAYDLVAKWDDALAWLYKFEAGNMLAEQGESAGSKPSFEGAVSAYQRALQLVSIQSDPKNWGKTQNNLGNVLHALGDREASSKRLTEAATALQAAIEALPRERDAAGWGMAQNNLGNVLFTLGERESDTAKLREAAVAFSAALEAMPRDSAPFDWSRAQNNLGNALRLLGEREGDMARLREAATAYRTALEEQPRASVPLMWAVTQSNLGTALRSIGERETGTETLLESASTYRLALEVLAPELAPVDWSMVQNNLGNVLTTIGQREGDIGRIKEAVMAFQSALRERKREDSPALWAETQNNLGSALALIGQTENDAAALEGAAEALRAVLAVRTKESMPYQWGITQSNLGAVLQMLGAQRGDRRVLAEAIAAHRSSLLVFTREQAPQQWSKAQNNLGNALRSLGELETGTATLKQALTALKASLEERSRKQSPHQWANTQVLVGLTSLELVRRGGGRRAADQAIQAFEAALGVYREANASQNIAKVESFLAEARALKR